MMSSQEVPQGYKKTKVGVLPLEWEKLELKELIDISAKKFNPKTSQEEKKCIELEHLSQKTGQLLGYINSKEQQSTKNIFNKGQILYGKLRPYLQKYWKAEFDGVCSSEIWVLNGKKIINEYLFYLVQTNKFNQIANVSSGSKMPRADWKYMAEIPFIIPPLKEQQKIAKILTTWNDSISKQEELIKAKEQLKKGLMQKLLSGEVRFDGFSEEWEEVRLGDLCKIAKSGGTPTSSNKLYYDGNIPFLAISDITKQGKYLTYTSKKISQIGLDNSASWIVPINTIIYSMYASVGFVSINKIPIATSQAVINLILKDNINLEYIYYYLLDYKKYIHKYIETGTQGNLNAQIVKNLRIKLPSLQEQRKIAQVLSTADKEIKLLKNELESLKEQKKGLMQRLLTGEVKVEI